MHFENEYTFRQKPLFKDNFHNSFIKSRPWTHEYVVFLRPSNQKTFYGDRYGFLLLQETLVNNHNI